MTNSGSIFRKYFVTLGVIIFLGYILTVAYIHWQGERNASSGSLPLYTDFTSLYAASLMISREPAENLYDNKKMYQGNLDAAHLAYSTPISNDQARAVGSSPWHYPPIFILFCIPLIWFPYFFSYALWLAVGFGPYLYSIRKIANDSFSWPIALAAPPVFFNIMYGQTGFYTAGFIASGLALLGRHPVAAGVFIGLASFKPHFGILIPLALILAKMWKTFFSASATVLGLSLISVLAYGLKPWEETLAIAQSTLGGFRAARYDLDVMTSPFSTVHLAGGHIYIAWGVQAIFSLAAILIVIKVWAKTDRLSPQLGLRSAILCCTTLLAVPMVFIYDLALLVPVGAWLYADMKERGWQMWEGTAAVAMIFGTLILQDLAERTAFQLGPILVTGLLVLLMRRLKPRST